MGKIYIAAHKQFDAPDDNMYVPLHCGRIGKSDLGYIGDDTGVSISHKNSCYCELTGIYWVWKNLPETDYVGLVHYRRYFREKNKKCILSEATVEKLFKDYEIILPCKRHYYIETCFSQYGHAHNINDLLEAKKVIAELYPEYSDSFDKVMSQRSIYIYNMFVMKYQLFDDYCGWLFPVLSELEKRIDISGYDEYNSRVFGFISERLFNVWLDHNKYKSCEMPILFVGKQKLVAKYMNFIIRKITGGRGYEKKSAD